MKTTLIFETVRVAWLEEVGPEELPQGGLVSRLLVGLALRRLAEDAAREPRVSFKYYVCFWSPLVCCGMKTTLIIETVRAAWLEEVRAAWLEEVGLEDLALRRAGIQEAGWVDPEEARRGVGPEGVINIMCVFGALWSGVVRKRH